MELKIRGETFDLLPERLLHWPREKLLAVADLHLGKATVFQRQGLWLPSQAQEDDLDVLSRVADRLGIKRILFLGDLVHNADSVPGDVMRLFAKWRTRFQGSVIVTLGNHDRGLERNWPEEWASIEHVPAWEAHGFRFQHEEPKDTGEFFYWLGHLHPSVTLKDGADRLRLPCFLIGDAMGVLPAFSRLAGGLDVSRYAGRKYAVTTERVLPIR